MKILHTADWHLDAPMEGRESLRQALSQVPRKIAALCKAEGCDLLIIAGDLFDGPCTASTLTQVKSTLSGLGIPVVITPGNHDYITSGSPYLGQWPENVHIFKENAITSLSFPELDLRLYGAGYTSMDCPGLLRDFRAEGPEKWHIGVLHGELSASSAYCPMTPRQIQETGLDYLALGHIHKLGTHQAGSTYCAWPGCPMGRGFDETGEKGVILLTLEEGLQATFRALDTPRFFDEYLDAEGDPGQALSQALPTLPTQDYYRMTLTGYCEKPELTALAAGFPHIPNLTLRDETAPQQDLWRAAGEDTLEGAYFAILQTHAQSPSEALRHRAELAAQISRRILDGLEVKLP